mmetsp:Transcript_3069/g.5814  ORF Transcript_3069/g.5814 Transcript_3069/m.5814 type:complete len:85 (+) Transcript_3069:83-337(+)
MKLVPFRTDRLEVTLEGYDDADVLKISVTVTLGSNSEPTVVELDGFHDLGRLVISTSVEPFDCTDCSGDEVSVAMDDIRLFIDD